MDIKEEKRNILKSIILIIILFLIISFFVYSNFNKKPKELYSNESIIEINENEEIDLGNDSKNTEYSSDDEFIAKVDEKGKVTPVSPGKTKIYIKNGNKIKTVEITVKETPKKQQDNEKQESEEKTKEEQTTTTKKHIVDATNITLNKVDYSLGINETYKLVATVNPDNTTDKTVKWRSSNSTIVSVKNGKIKGLKTGTATITAETINGKTASCKITVGQSVNSISLSQSNVSIGTGSSPSVTVKVSIFPSNATNKNITWISSNTNVATVTNGRIKGIHSGTATITARTNNGKTATVKVKVTSTERIHFIPVKQNKNVGAKGDAILLESNGYFGMVDTGCSNITSTSQVISFLNTLGIKKNGTPLDFILLTHIHEDHAGGFIPILQSGIKVKNLYMKRYSTSLGKNYTGYTNIINCANGNNKCTKVDKVVLTQTIDNTSCPEKSNRANSNFNCTANLNFQNMKIKLYNTGYVMKDGDLGENGTKYKCHKKKDGVVETYNANYESIYAYIFVNNHKIVLAADALGDKAGTDLNTVLFETDRWYKQILKDTGTGIDILKAPHHGDNNSDINYTNLKPKNVVVTNSLPALGNNPTRIKAYTNLNARILYVEYYDNTRKTLLGELNPATITWGREGF